MRPISTALIRDFSAADTLYIYFFTIECETVASLFKNHQWHIPKHFEVVLNRRNALIEKNMRLVAHIVKKYTSTERDYINEDLISVGTIGLIKAVDSFDIERNVRFSTYAAKCIDNEILMLFRQDKKKEREVSLNEPIGKDKEGNEISLKDIIGEDSEKKQPDAVEDYMFYEQIKCIYGNIEKVLAPREIEILKYRYGLFGAKECTQNELADRLGISRSYVSRIEKKALGKLREVLIERKLI